MYSSVGKYVPQGCLPSIFHPHNPHPIFGTNSSPVVSMSIPGVSLLYLLFFHIFWHQISRQNFGTKLVSIIFSLRPEDVLLVLTSRKLVWIYYHYYLQFCFAMWIIYVICQLLNICIKENVSDKTFLLATDGFLVVIHPSLYSLLAALCNCPSTVFLAAVV